MPVYLIEKTSSLSDSSKVKKFLDDYSENLRARLLSVYFAKDLNANSNPGHFLDINRRRHYKATVTWTVRKLELGSFWNQNNLIFISCGPSTRAGTLATLNSMDKQKLTRDCLITVGATAEFPALVQAALTESTLKQLAADGYTRVVFQVGDSIGYFHELKPLDSHGMDITAFAFNKTGLSEEMRACQAKDGVSQEGLVISHAGAGTILDALRFGLPLIVVPNISLLDNHQEELALELERQGYVVKGDVKDLAAAIRKVEKKVKKAWGSPEFTADISGVVNKMVGYEEEVRSMLD